MSSTGYDGTMNWRISWVSMPENGACLRLSGQEQHFERRCLGYEYEWKESIH